MLPIIDLFICMCYSIHNLFILLIPPKKLGFMIKKKEIVMEDTIYKRFEHTADIGIQIVSDSMSELYLNAGFALIDSITYTESLNGISQRIVKIDADNPQELLMNWLRELLSFWVIDDLFVMPKDMQSISETHLSCLCFVTEFDPTHHDIKNDIKAVTYHDLDVSYHNGKWQTKIIFDV